MDNIRRLLRWAKDTQGVQLNGIEPKSLPGRGIGVVATRKLKTGDVILIVPSKAIRSLHTIPAAISGRLHPDMSIQGLLAAELALGWEKKSPSFPLWNAVLPMRDDVEASVPFMWPVELQRLLPTRVRLILEKQERMFTRDWANFSRGFNATTRENYQYAWLLVNSRTFYYETTATALYPWEDRLAQLPVADLFNHAETGCPVSFSNSGYDVRADREYGVGQEVHISYGGHSNDYLLGEYGFVMAPNKWDEVYLDAVVLPRLDEGQKAAMERGGKPQGFAFKVNGGAGDKLQAALKILSKGKSTPDEVLVELVSEYLSLVNRNIADVMSMEAGSAAQRGLLARRWEQIRAILEQALGGQGASSN